MGKPFVDIGSVRTGRGTLTHGRSNTPEYVVWHNMIDRCINPRRANFRYYGARGVTVCDRWRKSFAAFFADMGTRPSRTTLDRIDNDGNYEPGNCRWATREVQDGNRRARIVPTIEVDRVARTRREWAAFAGITTHAITFRIRTGWPLGEALTRPKGFVYRKSANGPVEKGLCKYGHPMDGLSMGVVYCKTCKKNRSRLRRLANKAG